MRLTQYYGAAEWWQIEKSSPVFVQWEILELWKLKLNSFLMAFFFSESFLLKVIFPPWLFWISQKSKLIALRWATGVCFCPQHRNSYLIVSISLPSIFMKIPFKTSDHRCFFSSLSWSWGTERLHSPVGSTLFLHWWDMQVTSDSNQALLILLLVSPHLGCVALLGTQANLFNQSWYRPENSSLVPGKHHWLRKPSVNKQPFCLRSIFTVSGWSEETCGISLILCDI